MYCMKCGAQNTSDGHFCIRCGAALDTTVSQPAGPAAGAGPRSDPPSLGGGQAPAADIESLLQELNAHFGSTRLEAIETISRMPESDFRIVRALVAMTETDPRDDIQLAAAEALRAPAHQAILQHHPNLAGRAQRVSSQSLPESQPSPPTGSTPPAAALRSVAAPGTAGAPSSYASSGYAALRGMASLFNLIGWGFVGLGGLGAIGGLVALGSDEDLALVGLVILVASVFWGGLGYVSMRVVAESISVLLDIEANTRRAANLLEQRLK